MTPNEIFKRLGLHGAPLDRKAKSVKDGPPDKLITIFEHHFGITLPAEYLDLLRFHNGGTPKRRIFRLKNVPAGYTLEDGYSIGIFYYLDDDRDGFNNLWTVTERFRPFIGKTGLPIAEDVSGDVIFIETKTGQVQYATHEVNFEKAVVADSFLELLAALEYDPEDEPQS